jgi:hypothetical protein
MSMHVKGNHGSTFEVEVNQKGLVTTVLLEPSLQSVVPEQVPGYGGRTLDNGEVFLDLLDGPMMLSEAVPLLSGDEEVWSKHAQHAQLMESWEQMWFAKTDIALGDLVGWLADVNKREASLGLPWSTWSLVLDDLGLVDLLRSCTHGGVGLTGLSDMATAWLALAQRIHDSGRISIDGHLMTVGLDSGIEVCFDTTLAEHVTRGRTWTMVHTPEHHAFANHPEAQNALGPWAELWEPWWGPTLPLSRIAHAAWVRLIEDELIGEVPDADWASWYPNLCMSLLDAMEDEPGLWSRLNHIRTELEGA